ncbi:bifunctional diguanylate cyclase/phosphodiesterase [uncultured Cellulomonas sp.]|uniref:putative bifunctional diguanylate cyclase/phosphodiesterase n=1 Tax=uncultured Cellulomonas sp. TaxID=189682 RepID=UPI0026141048|nr:GGDEF domain-containing phosphodiesterase [uncultured Cellulomonas sp.]
MGERTGTHLAAVSPGDGDVDLLATILQSFATVGTDSLTVLRPVNGDDGTPVDFVVIADTGLTAQLAGRPSLGRTLRELMPRAFADRLVGLNQQVLVTGALSHEDFLLRTDTDGSPVGVATTPEAASGVADVLRIPVAGHVVVLTRDVTQARAAQRELLAANTRFERLLEHASDTIVVTTADRLITYASPSLAAVLGVDPQTLLGTRFGNFFSDRAGVTVGDDLFDRVLRAPAGGTARAEAEVRNGAGQVRRVAYVATNRLDDPVVGGVIINALDVTEQFEAQRRLRALALSDALTGLPNRRWFTRALDRALEAGRRSGRQLALLLLDVDDFKMLNDSLGHSAGDRLLVEMSRRMASVLHPGESIARLGGDEFVVLAQDLATSDDAVTVAERIAGAAGTRYDIGSLAAHVTVSLGAVTSEGRPADAGPADGVDLGAPLGAERDDDVDERPSPAAESLLADADAALYEAKRRGRNRVHMFDPELRERVLRRVHLQSDLHRALDADELVVHWQPIVRTSDRRHVAAEALVRWRHPTRGLLAAADFLPGAVGVGLVPALCTRAVDLALAQAARWEEPGGVPEVFINLAPIQLSRPALADELAERVERYGVAPHRIQFEVAEDVLGADVCRLAEQLTRMREHGFRIALDDFGAGNTALTWLRRLPVDTLKLDRDFTSTLHEPATRTIVRSILRLATDLGVRTVAEGIETPEQLDFFTDAGCDYTQGYLHGYPSPPDQVWPPAHATVR